MVMDTFRACIPSSVRMLPEAEAKLREATAMLTSLAESAKDEAEKTRQQLLQQQEEAASKTEDPDVEMDDKVIDECVQNNMGGDEFKDFGLEAKRKLARDLLAKGAAKKPKTN